MDNLKETIEMHPVSPWGTAIKWGVIVGVVCAILSYLTTMNVDYNDLSQADKQPFWKQLIQYIVIIIGLVLAHNEHKKESNGFMSYGRGVGIGAISGIASGLLLAIYTYIQMAYVHPELLQAMYNTAMEQQPEMDDEQMEAVEKWMKFFFTPGMMTLIAFFGIEFFSVVFSLVVSIFTQKKPVTDF